MCSRSHKVAGFLSDVEFNNLLVSSRIGIVTFAKTSFQKIVEEDKDNQ